MKLVGLLCSSLFLGSALAGSIEGRVTNSITGDPVIGATVRFIGPHSYVYTGVTDSSGTYRVSGLDDGRYQGEVFKDGFADFRQGATLKALSTGGTLQVSGAVPAHLDIQLNAFGAIR